MGKRFNLRKRAESFKYAGKGFKSLVRSEHNAWIHLAAIILVTIAGFCFGITRGEWIAVVICFGVVLSAEAVNTAIERLVDLVSPGRHPLAGEAKDIAAAAVLIAAATAAVVGAIIFIPHILALFKL